LNRLFSWLLFLLLLGSVVATTFVIRPVEGGTICVPRDYPTIQAAINAASSGDMVYVESGTYHENLVINKALSLVGKSPDTTCIYGSSGRPAVYVEANGVDVSGFEIRSGGGPYDNGLLLNGVEACEVSDNKAVDSFYGIGIDSCSNCSIINNILWQNHFGIGGGLCTDCVISGNTVANNQVGIAIDGSSSVQMKDNTVTENQFGIASDAPQSDNSITGNIITDNAYGIYLNYDQGNENITGDRTANNTVARNVYGILQIYSPNTRITQNVITDNTFGLCLLSSQVGNCISQNTISLNSGYGIRLESSSNNTIVGNGVTDNGFGIELDLSSDNTLTGNIVANSECNFGVSGLSSEDFINYVDASNTVNGRPIYYWIGRHDTTVPSDAGYVALVNCTSITVQDLTLTNELEGILLAYTTNSTIAQNNLMENLDEGVLLYSANNNTVTENNITANNKSGITLKSSSHYNTITENNLTANTCGILVDSSSNNAIYHNNLAGNTAQVHNSGVSTNAWDNGYPSGGNHWSDYAGTDSHGGPYQNESYSDGIGDTPYAIDTANADNYPIMKPWTPFWAAIIISSVAAGGRVPCII
jgi:parallel beta-helix repeat protein